jgi:uncharacterized protein YkwD
LAVALLGFGLTVCLSLAWPAHAAAPAAGFADTPHADAAQLIATTAYTRYLPIVIGSQPSPTGPLSPAEQLIALINAERARHGLPPLVAHSILMQVALAHSQDMAAHGFFSHTNPDGLNPCQRMAQAGYDVWACGENIGAGYPTPEMMFNMWLSSPGHRRNILSPDFTEVGVGYVRGGEYGHYWTIDFGARR